MTRCSRAKIRIVFIGALPSAQLKVYSETGHCPNWERPAEVAADINSFISAPADIDSFFTS